MLNQICKVGELTPNGFFKTLSSCSPELVFPPHFFKIMVEVKASGHHMS